MIPAVDGDAADLIARHADRPAFVDLILALNELVSGLSDIGRESEKKIFGHALLQGNAGGWVRIVPANQGINLQAGDAS